MANNIIYRNCGYALIRHNDGAEVKYRLEPAYFGNHDFLVDANGNHVGVLEDDRLYLVGDSVQVTGDSRGYIGPGITVEGPGLIYEVTSSTNINTDHYYGVKMWNGQHGFLKSARIKPIR